MTTELHSPPNESISAMNPNERQPPGGRAISPASPGTGLPQDDPLSNVPPRQRALLEVIVAVSLRLRLRGVDLESSTGLAGRELDLVALLTSSGPTSVKSLVADLGLPRSTMTAIVDRLQERGLVNRHPNPQDRRSVVLEATPIAHEALRKYHIGMKSLVDHIAKTLTDEEIDEYTRTTRKIATGF